MTAPLDRFKQQAQQSGNAQLQQVATEYERLAQEAKSALLQKQQQDRQARQ